MEDFYVNVESSLFRPVLHDERPWSFQTPSITHTQARQEMIWIHWKRAIGSRNLFFSPSNLIIYRDTSLSSCIREQDPFNPTKPEVFPVLSFLFFGDKSGPVFFFVVCKKLSSNYFFLSKNLIHVCHYVGPMIIVRKPHFLKIWGPEFPLLVSRQSSPCSPISPVRALG